MVYRKSFYERFFIAIERHGDVHVLNIIAWLVRFRQGAVGGTIMVDPGLFRS
jgi:hypothetical protein